MNGHQRWRTATGNPEQYDFSEVQPTFYLEGFHLKEQGPNYRPGASRVMAERKTEVLKGHWKTTETKAEARHLLLSQGGERATYHGWDTNMRYGCDSLNKIKAPRPGGLTRKVVLLP